MSEKEQDDQIAIVMTRKEWESLSHGLADILCWLNGFKAAWPKDEDHGILSEDNLKRFNLKIKDRL